MFNKLSEAISVLTRVLSESLEQRKIEFDWLRSHAGLATKLDLEEMGKRIMSKIGDFATAQNAFNDRIDAAVTGLQTDIDALNAEILKLQSSPGAITPEDQASLDALQTRGESIAAKLEALDALTPPPPPTT